MEFIAVLAILRYTYFISQRGDNIEKTNFKNRLEYRALFEAKLISDFNKTDSDGHQIVEEFMVCNPEHYEAEFKSKEKGKAYSKLVNKDIKTKQVFRPALFL